MLGRDLAIVGYGARRDGRQAVLEWNFGVRRSIVGGVSSVFLAPYSERERDII